MAGFGDTNFSFRVFLEGSRYFLVPFCARLLVVANGQFLVKRGRGQGRGGCPKWFRLGQEDWKPFNSSCESGLGLPPRGLENAGCGI